MAICLSGRIDIFSSMGFEIRDAIYGDIVLSQDEALLLDTYEMQRLRHIKQLGSVDLVYPSANHTRFEHSLGTRWLIQKIIRISNLPVDPADEKILYKAALLHDIAAACYVHVTERLKRIGLPIHEEIVQYVLDGTYKRRVQEKRKTELRFLCDLLAEEEKEKIHSILVENNSQKLGEKAFLQQLVRGYIDADTLDYLRRDSFFLGLPYGNYDDRIFASFRIAKFNGGDCIAFRNSNDTINSIVSILYSRFTLRKAAYLHPTVLIADEMFLNALKQAFVDHAIDEFDVFILGDCELLLKMRKSERARTLVDYLISRRLFKRAYVIGSQAPVRIRDIIEPLEKDITEQMDFLRKIATETGLGQEDILFSFPPPIGWKDFGNILLVSADGKVTTLGNVLPEDLSLLEKNYRSLWRFMVSVSPQDPDTREKVHRFCSEYLNYPSDVIPKKSLDEFRKLQEDVKPIITALQKKAPSSAKVLLAIAKANKPVSRDEIAKELNLKPTTVSHYMTLIENHINGSVGRIIFSERIGRHKFWYIDERIKEVLY